MYSLYCQRTLLRCSSLAASDDCRFSYCPSFKNLETVYTHHQWTLTAAITQLPTPF